MDVQFFPDKFKLHGRWHYFSETARVPEPAQQEESAHEPEENGIKQQQSCTKYV